MATAVKAPPEGPRTETFRRIPIDPNAGGKCTLPDRLMSLDAFRGFIMTTLAGGGFGLATLSDDPTWGWLGLQFRHVEWEGLAFWDLIQPAFMFMVGLAMPFAFKSRIKTEGVEAVWRHVAYRAFMLIVLSNVLISISAGRPRFQLINVLAQIGFTYFICYWLMKLSFKKQAVIAAGILVGYTALYVAFPGAEGAHAMGDNFGEKVDQFIFGASNPGHWATINFIPSTVVTLFGIWCGYLMVDNRPHAERMRILAAGSAACFVGGFGLSPLNPIIKRIHTASFTLASCGWVILMLLFFYWLVEVKRRHKAVFPLVVVGMNSMFIYCLHMVQDRWIDEALAVFTNQYAFLGKWGPVAQSISVFLVMWYLCYWLYQRRIFIKI